MVLRSSFCLNMVFVTISSNSEHRASRSSPLELHFPILLQKRVIRLICGAERLDHTNLLFHNVHILKLPDLVKLKTAIIMFKAYRYILPINVQKLFRIHESRYSSRHECKFKQIYVRTNLNSICISVTGAKLWNTLDNSMISCKNIHHFKKCYTVE